MLNNTFKLNWITIIKWHIFAPAVWPKCIKYSPTRYIVVISCVCPLYTIPLHIQFLVYIYVYMGAFTYIEDICLYICTTIIPSSNRSRCLAAYIDCIHIRAIYTSSIFNTHSQTDNIFSKDQKCIIYKRRGKKVLGKKGRVMGKYCVAGL